MSDAFKFRVLICGSRDWSNQSLIRQRLESIPKDSVIIHGGCRGADQIAGRIAEDLGMQVECYPADWEQHGKSAGPIRNQQMLDEGNPNLVIAFHDDINSSKGTRDMIRRTQNAGIKYEVIKS